MYFIKRITRFKHILNKSRCYSTKKEVKNANINKIRNIGILAHIDAGIIYLLVYYTFR